MNRKTELLYLPKKTAVLHSPLGMAERKN